STSHATHQPRKGTATTHTTPAKGGEATAAGNEGLKGGAEDGSHSSHHRDLSYILP
ncbi:hypothetical protein A2U01_0114827, partial [Trifolium medium]|nr:hypothetical protein [Trifolium medium]